MSTEEKINEPARDEESPAGAWRESLGYDYQDVHNAGKRCGLVWAPWMGDWFTSHSPRNDNSHAEGYWDHWVDLAIKILQDPLTVIVRPDAHKAAAEMQAVGFYSEAGRTLTDEELQERFKEASR